MFSIALLIFAGALTMAVIRRIGILSPTSLVCALITVNMITFYLIENSKIGSGSDLFYSHSYMFRNSYLSLASETLSIYATFLMTLALVAWRVPINIGQIQLLRGPIHSLSTRPILYFCIGVLFVCAIHAILTNLKFLEVYYQYLQLRIPEYYGLDGTLSSILIVNIGLVGVLSSATLALSIYKNSTLLIVLALPSFIYTFVFQLASHSRWTLLQLFIILVLMQPNKNRKHKFLAISIFLLLILTYFSTFFSRASDTLGLFTAFDLSRWEFSKVIFMNMFANIFPGGFTLSEVISRYGIEYPMNYKYLSFSPAPSSIDGFKLIVDQYRVNINAHGPFSSIGELYWFGNLWMMTFFILSYYSLKVTELVWQLAKKTPTSFVILVAFLFFAITIYGHALLHQYPIRNSVRWIWLPVVTYPFFLKFYLAQVGTYGKRFT